MIHAINVYETNYFNNYDSVTFEEHSCSMVHNMDTIDIRQVTYIGYICMESLQVLDILPMEYGYYTNTYVMYRSYRYPMRYKYLRNPIENIRVFVVTQYGIHIGPLSYKQKQTFFFKSVVYEQQRQVISKYVYYE